MHVNSMMSTKTVFDSYMGDIDCSQGQKHTFKMPTFLSLNTETEQAFTTDVRTLMGGGITNLWA